MKLFDLIHQTTVAEVIDHEEDSQPNKIKEKLESLENTLVNRVSIPIGTEVEQKAVEVEEQPVTVSIKEDPDMEPEPEKTTVVVTEKENDKNFEIFNMKDLEIAEGLEKAINVKESMLFNMKNKNAVKQADIVEEHVISDVNHEETTSLDKLDFLLKNSNGYNGSVKENINAESKIEEIPKSIEQQLSNVVDLDATFVEIKETRNRIMDITKRADMAEYEASESAKKLQEMSTQFSEAEKALENSQLKSNEMEQRILSILNDEKNKLNQQIQEKETLIIDANKRKEQNDSKIVDYQSRINSTREKENEINERISHQQELLSALGWFDNDVEEEKNTRKIA